MTRGKHASLTAARKARELSEEVDRLKADLTQERAGRAADAAGHKEELARLRREFAGEVAEHVERSMVERVERISNGIAAASWKAQKIAMTKHLSYLFFKGYLDWDRLRGDVEVLSFIAVHGDIDSWFVLAKRFGHRANRSGLRNAQSDARRRMGLLDLFIIDKDVRQALDPSDSASERVRKEREELDQVVREARNAFMDVELDSYLADTGAAIAKPTENQIELHRAVMAAVDEMAAGAAS